MELSIRGHGPAAPFLSAQDRFETEYDLAKPVEVRIVPDPDERTRASHYDDRHVLHISRKAATSAMAVELAVHEYSHMWRYEEPHPSHLQSTREALFLALAGRRVEQRKLTHCYQIANHIKDIYADDLTFSVGPVDKMVSYFESRLAASLADQPQMLPDGWTRLTAAADPDITAINAAFALALLERHDAVSSDHRIYDLAHAASRDAPEVDLCGFKTRFRDLGDMDERRYRQTLVDALRDYVLNQPTSASD